MDLAKIMADNPGFVVLPFRELYSIMTANRTKTKDKVDSFEKFIIYSDDNNKMVFSENFDFTYPITFQNCIFLAEKGIYFNGIIGNGDLTFNHCHFLPRLEIVQAKFSKTLSFFNTYCADLHFEGGSFQRIYITGSELGRVVIDDIKYTNIEIGELITVKHDDKIEQLVLKFYGASGANINVYNADIGELYLMGNHSQKLSIENCDIEKVSVNYFKNTGELKLFRIKPAVPNSGLFRFDNSILNTSEFYNVNFAAYKEVGIFDSIVTDCHFINCLWRDNLNSQNVAIYEHKDVKDLVKLRESRYQQKEAYRQLRLAMGKHNDKVQEMKFYGSEMKIHNKLLDWDKPWKGVFWDKVILYFSHWFSGYGQSFVRPLVSILVGHLILFFIALVAGGFKGLQFTFTNPNWEGLKKGFEYYFTYINPLRSLDKSFSGYLIIIDTAMRIWSSYMIYNLIRVSRRFLP